jgi:DNA cross-link repair 1A protein
MPAIAPLIARMQAQTFLSSSLTPMRNSNHKQMLYGVPYSEHSSFFELTCFALSVDWGKIIATVNVGSQVGRSKMSQWFERWELERRRRKEKGDSLIIPSRSDEYW